jgi:hypothetical protein
MYNDPNDIYFKNFSGPYSHMEGRLINAIRALELRISALEHENKVSCDTTYVIKGDQT